MDIKTRKFDLRHYVVISRLFGKIRAYWFGEGYVRTSSYEYNLKDISDEMIHLTNDAIQKQADHYGKYQQGNKISYAQLQKYIEQITENKSTFTDKIYSKMLQIAIDTISSSYLQLDPKKLQHNFEILGFDFMIDENLQTWLIEVNTNPCFELSNKLLSRIIPTMLEQTIRLHLDPLFPPPTHYQNTLKYLAPDKPLHRLQFTLIFDQSRDGEPIEQLLKSTNDSYHNNNIGIIDEQDQIYQDDGSDIDFTSSIQ